MNTETEKLIAWIAGIDAILDDLKITDGNKRSRLKMIAARQMGLTLGELLIDRIDKEVIEEMEKKGGDKNART